MAEGGSDWAAGGAANGASADGKDETADRTSVIIARLKTIYRKAVLPVEKRYRYDYFFDSPFLTDAEFDCKCSTSCKIRSFMSTL
jgi:hypothetical protein